MHVCSRLNMYAMKNESHWSPVYEKYNVLIYFRLERRFCSRCGVIKMVEDEEIKRSRIPTNDDSSSEFRSQNMRYEVQMGWWETWLTQITSMKIIKRRIWKLPCVEFSRFFYFSMIWTKKIAEKIRRYTILFNTSRTAPSISSLLYVQNAYM